MIFLDIEAPSKPQYFTLQQVLCKDVMSVNGKELSLSLPLSLQGVCIAWEQLEVFPARSEPLPA